MFVRQDFRQQAGRPFKGLIDRPHAWLRLPKLCLSLIEEVLSDRPHVGQRIEWRRGLAGRERLLGETQADRALVRRAALSAASFRPSAILFSSIFGGHRPRSRERDAVQQHRTPP
jgi:hypothetical protein